MLDGKKSKQDIRVQVLVCSSAIPQKSIENPGFRGLKEQTERGEEIF
jgi:hypothetical protein